MKQKDLLFLFGSFFFLVAVYLPLSIYHNSVTSTIPEDLNIQITPIAPTFDTKAISDLSKRNNITPIYQVGPSQPVIPTPTPTPASLLQSSSSAQQSSNVATKSGTKL